jgi:hypothetical protein
MGASQVQSGNTQLQHYTVWFYVETQYNVWVTLSSTLVGHTSGKKFPTSSQENELSHSENMTLLNV